MTLHATIEQSSLPGELKRRVRFQEVEEGGVHVICEEWEPHYQAWEEEYRVTVPISELRKAIG